jgi:circadian clock protein KaiB
MGVKKGKPELALPPLAATQRFEDATRAPDERHFRLRLYICGSTPRSQDAIRNIQKLCTERLKGRVDLGVIDVYQSPEVARSEQLIAVPTLVKELPLPMRRLIGDLSDESRVLVGLELIDDSDPKPGGDTEKAKDPTA